MTKRDQLGLILKYMFEDIVIIHRPKDPSKETPEFVGVDTHSWVLWKTCLRQIAIGSVSPRVCPLFMKKTDQVYSGSDAYRFFLETVSGLHSPIIGETEIMGQFKQMAAELENMVKSGEANPTHVLIQKFVSSALADTKNVRETHLRDLGNRTYGSLLRKHIAGSPSLHVIGAGKLVREILPWLINKVPVTSVYCRRDDQGWELKKEFRTLNVKLLSEAHSAFDTGTWIVAAPMKSGEIQKLFNRKNKVSKIVDLRETSHSDVLQIDGVEVLKLHEFFNQIAGTQKEVQFKAEQAKDFIACLVTKRFRMVEIRPFGWEDLCG